MSASDDTTTDDQRAYWFVLHAMIGEAARPSTAAEMRGALKALRRQADREAKRLQVPYEDWHDEVARRMSELMTAMDLPVPTKAVLREA